MSSFNIDSQEKKINTQLGFKSNATITIGGNDPSKFVPNINSSIKRKIEDEFFININFTDLIVDGIEDVAYDENKTELKTDKRIDKWSILEDGKLDYEIVLEEKQASNTLSLEIKCSQELTFYHQPELTQEEIDEGCIRPDNVINSYAIYCNKMHNDYANGKIAHIERSWVEDKNGNRTWCEQNIEVNNGIGIWNITIPEDIYNDESLYPLTVGPILGYDVIGGATAPTVRGIALKFEIPENVNMARIISINTYLAGYGKRSLGFYNNTYYHFEDFVKPEDEWKDQPYQLLNEISYQSTNDPGFNKLPLDIFLPKSGKYWLALVGKSLNSAVSIYYDASLTAQRAVTKSGADALPSEWDPTLVTGADEARKPTLWATYLEVDADVELIEPEDGSIFNYPNPDQNLLVRLNEAPAIPLKFNFYDANDDSLIGTVDNREIYLETDYYNVPPYDFESNGSSDFITWESYKEDIVQIDSGVDFVVALLNDGTVLAGGAGVGTGPEDINVTGWTDIIEISASSNHLIGLKSDGTVLACGADDYYQVSYILNGANGFQDLIHVSAGGNVSVGLKANGTVVAIGNQMSMAVIGTWQNVVQISAGQNFVIALKSDGTCIGNGYNTYHQLRVTPTYGWNNIIKVATGTNHSVGLKSDGTVVTAFSTVGPHIDSDIVYGIDTWTDIVDIYATRYGTVGIKADDTMVVAGYYNCILDFEDEDYDFALANSRLLQNNNPEWNGINKFALGWYNMYTFKYEVPSDAEIIWSGLDEGYHRWYTELAYDEEEEIPIFTTDTWSFLIRKVVYLYLVSPYDGYEVSILDANPTNLVADLKLYSPNIPLLGVNFRRYPDNVLYGTYNFETAVGTKATQELYDIATNWNSLYNDIVFLQGSNTWLLAVRSDGTCLSDGGVNKVDVSTWTDIFTAYCGSNHAVGLKTDGTVIAGGENSSGQCDVTGPEWSDIIQLDCGNNFTVGLKSDGTVVATGDNYAGQCNVETWENIRYISCGYNYTVGIKNNGECVATGNNNYGQCNVTVANGWESVMQISAGYDHTVGIKSNGDRLFVGHAVDDSDDIFDSDWDGVIQLVAGKEITAGLKSDATVIYTFPGTSQYLGVGHDVKSISATIFTERSIFGIQSIEQPNIDIPIYTPGEYRWYAEFNDINEIIQTDPWLFTVTAPDAPIITNPNPSDDSTIYSNEFVYLSVQVDDYQGGLIDVEFFASDGDPIGSTTITAGERAEIPWATLPIGGYGWYAVATDSESNETTSEIFTFSVVTALTAPTITLLTPIEGKVFYNNQEVRLYVNIQDPNIGETIVVNFYNAATHNLIGTKNVAGADVPGGVQKYLIWGILPVGDYSWYVIATDSHGYSSTSETRNFSVVVAPTAPTITDPHPTPSDYFPFQGEPVDLSVLVTDPNIEDTITVTFYNAEDDSIIGVVEDVTPGERPEVPWNITEHGYYCWYAVADDGTFITQSETFCFLAELYIEATLPEQEIIINTFTPNSVENIKRFQLSLIGTPYLDEPLEFRNVVSYGDDLSITKMNQNYVRVSKGNCSIGGVLIEIQQNRDLYPNSLSSYIFSNDDIPLSYPGSGIEETTMYVVVYYKPTESDQKAYLGLIRNKTLLDENREFICILGEIDVTISDVTVTINDVDLTNRDFIFNVFDGGWIY